MGAALVATVLALGWNLRTPSPAPGHGAAPAADVTAGMSPGGRSDRAPAPAVVFTVCLQPLGEHDASLLAPIGRGIGHAYGFAVRTLATRPLPAAAWYPARGRYRAPALLDHLLYDVMPAAAGCHAVVGFTAVDVSATRAPHADWGVLGLAYHGGRVAVVSSFRLRGNVDRRRLTERAVKVVIHELGHVVGLPHRSEGPACIMNDAVGAVATIDRAEGPLCAGERAEAERFLGFALPADGGWDWRVILAEEPASGGAAGK